ncbi:hypothetical protein U1Q18_033951 [Sarracenia purpurea var. burkii]
MKNEGPKKQLEYYMNLNTKDMMVSRKMFTEYLEDKWCNSTVMCGFAGQGEVGDIVGRSEKLSLRYLAVGEEVLEIASGTADDDRRRCSC